MSPLPPSRKDVTGPPPRDVSDLRFLIRHHGSYLRSLDPGYLGGRFATPSPVRSQPSQLVGDDGGGSADERSWQWEDRYTVTATGTQKPHLTYEPVEESLFVRWHPQGRGGLPITNEYFTVDGNVVTIPDPGILAVGDQFSFQYEFEDLADAGEDLPTLTLRDTWKVDSNTSQGLPSLPALTQIGDFIVIVATWADAGTGTIACLDSRFTQIGPGTNQTNMWVGPATSLAAPAFSNTAFRSCFAVAAFVEHDVRVAGSSVATDYAVNNMTIAQIAGSAAVAGVMDSHSVATGTGTLPFPWISAVSTVNGLVHAAICYWIDTDDTATPAGPANFNGGDGTRSAAIAAVESL